MARFKLRHAFWSSDEGLAALLGLLVLQIFIVIPMAAVGVLNQWVLVLGDFWLSLVAISGAVALRWKKRSMVSLGILLASSFCLRWLASLISFHTRIWMDSIVSIGIESALVAMILRQVFRAGEINRHRILGAVAVYLLIGIVCGEIYHLIDLLHPEAFTNMNGELGVARNDQILYFSFTTLTTTGYGDILPIHPMARAVANLEGLIGQLFPAILIARLVSLETASRRI